MSRFRLAAKLRQNADYTAIIRIIEAHGLKHEVRAGSKHPIMTVRDEDGKVAEWTITCTPRSVNIRQVERVTTKRLRAAGLIP